MQWLEKKGTQPVRTIVIYALQCLQGPSEVRPAHFSLDTLSAVVCKAAVMVALVAQEVTVLGTAVVSCADGAAVLTSAVGEYAAAVESILFSCGDGAAAHTVALEEAGPPVVVAGCLSGAGGVAAAMVWQVGEYAAAVERIASSSDAVEAKMVEWAVGSSCWEELLPTMPLSPLLTPFRTSPSLELWATKERTYYEQNRVQAYYGEVE